MRLMSITAGLLACMAVSAGMAAANEVTVATWGGTFTEKQRATILDPFTRATGTKVLDVTYTGGLGQLQAMAESGNAIWDVVQLGAPETDNACALGLIEPLDAGKLKNAADFVGTGISECGIGAIGWGMVIAYNTKLSGEEPKNWADFWNVEKFPGKRGMRREPQNNLEAALIADGVAPDQVYPTLSTPEGVDRAFAKLDEIKAHIQWWEAGAQPPEWLANGSVAMSTSFVGRILEAQSEGAPVQFSWRDAVYWVDYWAIVAGSKNLDDAYAFLDFATSPQSQAAFSEIQPVAPVNVKSAALLAPERLAIMPAGENLKEAVSADAAFWNANLEALTERFNAWVSR